MNAAAQAELGRLEDATPNYHKKYQAEVSRREVLEKALAAAADALNKIGWGRADPNAETSDMELLACAKLARQAATNAVTVLEGAK